MASPILNDVVAAEPLVRVDLNTPRYDQKTFLGRFKHFLQITDVRTLFTTDQKLEESKKLIAEYNANGSPLITKSEAERLWEAKKIVGAIVHPDTGEKVPLPFRLSAFVPVNMVLAAGMLAPNPSIASVAFWQWMNQSYNLALNHSNRNASNELSNETILKTYGSAVAISCTVAVGLGQLVKRSTTFSPAVRNNIQRFVPYTAVAVAGVANVFMMRWNEVKEGIVVRDAEGNELGKSGIAGRNACAQVALSRCLSSLPCLTIPPIIMAYAERTAWFKANPRLAFPINLASITLMLFTGLPVAVSIFPQLVETSPERLESKFHGIKDKTGAPLTSVYYNRGL